MSKSRILSITPNTRTHRKGRRALRRAARTLALMGEFELSRMYLRIARGLR